MSTARGFSRFASLFGVIMATGNMAQEYVPPVLSPPRGRGSKHVRVSYKGSRSKYRRHYGANASARNLRHLAAGTHGL